MNAADPTTGSAYALFKFRTHPFNVLSSGFGLFHGDRPAYPFIARQRRKIFPDCQRIRVSSEGHLQIRWQLMDHAARDVILGHSSTQSAYVVGHPLGL